VVHVQADRVSQRNERTDPCQCVDGSTDGRIAVPVRAAVFRATDQRFRVDDGFLCRVLIQHRRVAGQLDLGRQRIGRCAQVDDAIRRIPLVIDVVIALIHQLAAIGEVDIFFREQVRELDLGTDEFAVTLQQKIFISRKVRQSLVRSGDRSACQRHPVLGRFRGERDVHDGLRVGVAPHMPLTVFGVRAIRQIACRRGVEQRTVLAQFPEGIGTLHPISPPESPQQFFRERIPRNGLLGRQTRIITRRVVELRRRFRQRLFCP
jgi:hypothetical protein